MLGSLPSRAFARTAAKTKAAEPVLREQQKHRKVRALREQFGVSKKVTFAQAILHLRPGQLKERREYLRTKYGFSDSEQRFIARQKPTFFLYDKSDELGVDAIASLLIEKFGFSNELVKTLVLKNPHVLGKPRSHIEALFQFLKKEKNIDELTAMRLIFAVPAILQLDIVARSREVEELFRIYHEVSAQEVTEIFLDFPYLYCCPTRKLQLFLGEFRKYRLTKPQILNLVRKSRLLTILFQQCKNSGGLLGCKPANLTGLFNYLKMTHKIKASEVVEIIDRVPEMALQNRKDLLRKKFDLMKKYNKSLGDVYLRNLFRRHPDLFLKSFASMQAKVTYITRNLNRQLHGEKAFPLLLHYNFSQHIWPRCESLREFNVKNFDLVKALATSDEEFCQNF